MKAVQRGFTLIELMIVVAIIGNQAALANPPNHNNTIRAQITEGLNLADGWKTAIAEYYANYGVWPSTANLAGTTNSNSKYVSTLGATGGTIQITYGVQVNNKVSGLGLSIRPYTNANNDIIWVCGSASAPGSVSSATGGSAGTNSVSPQYLPSSCHS
jgi:type IV pilus assembly protein PilA